MINKIVGFLRKLDKVPSFVWWIPAVVSAFFAQMYSFFRETTPSYFKSLFEATATSSTITAMYAGELDYNAMWIMTIIITPILSWGVFELISHILYKNLFVRRQINADKKFFNLVMRLGYTLCNILVGLVSLLYFFDWSDVVVITGSTVVQLLIEIAVYTLVYLILSESVINKSAVAAAYKRLLQFFCILLAVLSAYDLLITAVNGIAENLASVICVSVELLMTIGYFILGRYYIYPKLLKKQESYIEINVVNVKNSSTGGFDFDSFFATKKSEQHPVNDDPFSGPDNDVKEGEVTGKKKSKDDDEIFKGFGF